MASTNALVLASNEPQSPVYRQTPYRWLIVVAQVGFIFNTSLAHQAIAAVTTQVQQGFGCDLLFVNLSITLAPLVYIPFSFLSMYMFNTIRRDKVLKLAAAVQILGALTRMGSALTHTFWPIFVGSLMLAATTPFGFGSISMMAEVWFDDTQRATATSIMGTSDIIGMLATFGIQAIASYYGYFVSGSTPSHLRRETYNLMFIEGAFTIAIALFFIIVMKEKPPLPPSKVAESAALEMQLSMWKDVGLLLRNKNYVFLLLTYSLVYATFNSMMDAISPLFHSYYDKEDFISTVALVQIVTSILASIMTGPWLDRTKRYLCTLRVSVFATSIVAFSLIFIIPAGNYWLCALGICFAGLSAGPILPIGFDFGIQLTHPTPPPLVNGTLQTTEQVFEFLISTALVALCEFNPLWALEVIFLVFFISAILTVFIKEDLRVEKLSELEMANNLLESN